VPVPLDLDYSETSNYAPGETTNLKNYNDKSPEVERIKGAHELGKSLGKLALFIHAEVQAANKQIEAMHTIVNNPEKEEHKAILNEHFGEHHNIKQITQYVNRLKTGTVKIGAIKDTTLAKVVIATTRKMDTDPNIRFGNTFHSEESKRTPKDAAGTLIHEASHALLKTKDHYVRQKKNAPLAPVSKQDYQKLQKDIPVTKHDERLVTGCKFCILQDIISS
jgi:isochorismate synthase EntC